jgi:trehalose synthase-fused probable maltokinase
LIRHHGDYHLGQVLRTEDGDFQIIDFEGEPARPLAERRERSSALRDVAGMLRSFAYAAATLAAEQQSSGEVAARRASEWERGARDAFLDGYQGGGNCAYLPSTPRKVDAVRELFETEKVFYELSYELNNRPAWVWIPLAGISALRASPAGRR